MLPLFAYGTLRDPEYQRELFGRTFATRPASVEDFIVLSTGGGYLAATRLRGARLSGVLVELDAAGYAVADAWEDLTIYSRVRTDARADDGRIEPCYIYVRLGARGTPVADARLADRGRPDVIADIRQFRASAAFRDRR